MHACMRALRRGRHGRNNTYSQSEPYSTGVQRRTHRNADSIALPLSPHRNGTAASTVRFQIQSSDRTSPPPCAASCNASLSLVRAPHGTLGRDGKLVHACIAIEPVASERPCVGYAWSWGGGSCAQSRLAEVEAGREAGTLQAPVLSGCLLYVKCVSACTSPVIWAVTDHPPLPRRSGQSNQSASPVRLAGFPVGSLVLLWRVVVGWGWTRRRIRCADGGWVIHYAGGVWWLPCIADARPPHQWERAFGWWVFWSNFVCAGAVMRCELYDGRGMGVICFLWPIWGQDCVFPILGEVAWAGWWWEGRTGGGRMGKDDESK